MDEEYYQIEVEFEVAMTMHNYERGNLYMQSQFNSYKQGAKPLTLARSGFLDPKGSLTLSLKELVSMIPFASYFFSCEPTEKVTIKIFERFDNADYGLESIDFLVPNEALQFRTAQARVRTELTGIRYLMHSWFFTVALSFIFCCTFGISLCAVIFILLLKRLYLLSWL
mmetsp:Transcript_43559/g.57672  ORF Transcript_43559/g.57672 Transcript_43559/m.57672 type:complete len:169 (+) Transcript_43559:1142-1648(+)